MSPPSPILPGKTIGVVGGGQLGRMLAQSAHAMGYRVAVLTGGASGTPAGRVADHEFAAAFDDTVAVKRFLEQSDVVTWEFENVDVALAEQAEAQGVAVRPSGVIIAIAQDRSAEKAALQRLGVPVAPWCTVESAAELLAATDDVGLPAIAKTARDGYDGKGQVRIDSGADINQTWELLGGRRSVVEAVIDFDCELSVVVARDVHGTIATHGVMANHHVRHILDSSVVPAAIDPAVAQQAENIARTIAEGLDLIGVLCVELFCQGRDLIVNEIAPRPHNSGHCTIEAARASQFEQQLRAVCGLPLGDGTCRPAAMAQLLGDLWCGDEPAWTSILNNPDIHLHLYGKAQARPGRKMGHLTCVADTAQQALRRVLDARAALGNGGQ